MGNMLMNKRIEETILGGNASTNSAKEGEDQSSSDYRILPKHMYGGPKGLGDPMFRGLSKMEEDPMIPQRMRDTIRTQICIAEAAAINDCGKEMGVRDVLKCRPQRDALLACSHKWMENESFRERVTLEYLNERSHYRQTGIATVRYFHGKFVARHVEKDGTPFDENGHYRPRKPTGWDSFYSKDQPPPWTDYIYEN